ncbi:MAG: aminotransferase class I/II-fold pyridoxal phosphate-dependent enzyme, partial [Candidatus Diapherotrites archaeon]|nr:aminotransferase class I/II-fold pyridoxal phosphate-dependent enzyme [Candidatus Diapherotrites archaeon]
MTGWRLGYIVAHEKFTNQLLKIHDAFAICAPVVSQYAALAGLQGSQDCIQEFKKEFLIRRETIMKRIKESGIFSAQKPNGAYYVFPKILDGKVDSFDFSLKLLNDAHVVTIPGKAFGPTGEGHVRMAFCMSEETINSAFDRIDKFAKNYKK